MLDGICRCGWHVDDNREATDCEIAGVMADIDGACMRMRETLRSSEMDRLSARLVAKVDQQRAEIRDMSSGEREALAKSIAEEGGDMNYEQAREWIADMLRLEEGTSGEGQNTTPGTN
jgi:hypothetical protein